MKLISTLLCSTCSNSGGPALDGLPIAANILPDLPAAEQEQELEKIISDQSAMVVSRISPALYLQAKPHRSYAVRDERNLYRDLPLFQ